MVPDCEPTHYILNLPISQKYEWVFKVVYLLITIFSAILFNKMYLFQTLPEFDNVRKGTLKELIIYAVPFCIVFTVTSLFMVVLRPNHSQTVR